MYSALTRTHMHEHTHTHKLIYNLPSKMSHTAKFSTRYVLMHLPPLPQGDSEAWV